MELNLSSPITDLKGIGPSKAAVLKKIGITYIRDFLFNFPRRYEDFSNVTPIKDLQVGRQMTVKGQIKKVKSDWGFQGRRRLLRIYVDISDGTGTLHVTWYNLRFLAKQLTDNREIYIAGTVEPYKFATSRQEFAMRSPAMEFADNGGERTHTAAITPIYSETKGVTSRFIRYHVKKLLPITNAVPEYIPKDILKRHNLMGIAKALAIVHFPPSQEELALAQARLRFDELFFLQLAALVRRQQLRQLNAPGIKVSAETQQAHIKELPFTLTGAQKEAIKEILADMKLNRPMNRLLQGDVGSGKSAVALLAAKAALEAGLKVVYLAPTEILARQQAQSFEQSLPKHNVYLLIGSSSTQEKKAIKQALRGTGAVCVIGTHALLQEDVKGKDIGLVIIDEQHRFGVAQRKALRQLEEGIMPHLLSMTATPIPRTLNLTVYGDLDVSVLNELPAGRKPITTHVKAPDKQDDAIIHTLEEIHAGRQAFVVAPLIEESEKLEVKSAKRAYADMQKLFPGIAIGLMHGQLPSEEKELIMRHFAAGAIQMLVSTAVVEVGVNVPNATIMIIEGAERFGLAQLHQFRGRIGRGEHASTCYLFPTTVTAGNAERLKVLESTTDGFIIAEEDLRLRGPGEVYGVAQSGFGDLKVASLLDYPTIKAARSEAETILTADPDLKKYPILRKKVEQKNQRTHFE